jgi:N-acetylglucosamine-6-phosphate deacetylase
MNSSTLSRRTLLHTGGALVTALMLGKRGSAMESQEKEKTRNDHTKLKEVTLPGFVDLQTNGYMGVDFNDPTLNPEQIHEGIKAIAATGITRFLPTLVTSSRSDFQACAKAFLQVQDPALLGFHMEGPYISPLDGARGAHSKEFVREPTIDDFKQCQDTAGGKIRLVTLAPEVNGAIPLIEYLVKHAIRVAIGHTAASPEQIRAAVEAGASLSTHLGNGCAQLLPRHPNFIWEQLAEDRLMASFIVDGHHLPAATVKAMLRAKTTAHTILVTDATAAAGRPPGIYQWGNIRAELSPSGRVSLVGTPYLAGSALRMDDAVGNTVRFTGLPLEEVIPMATTHPAAYLGIQPSGKIHAMWNPVTCQLKILEVTT